MMRWPAPAKLNLFLRVTGRRTDGRHDLQTVFQLLDFGDEVEITPRRDDRIVLLDPPPGLDARSELSVRAAELLRARTSARRGVSIRLTKRIPRGAGLGGGSSNAATTLVALNRIWETGLGDHRLAALGLELGADVPVFVHGRSGWAEGVGERLRALPLPPLWYLVVHPRIFVSTAQVFADTRLTRDSPPLKMPALSAGRPVDVAALLAAAGNDCEPVVRLRHPAVDDLIEWLGAARRTGRLGKDDRHRFGGLRGVSGRGVRAAGDAGTAGGLGRLDRTGHRRIAVAKERTAGAGKGACRRGMRIAARRPAAPPDLGV